MFRCRWPGRHNRRTTGVYSLFAAISAIARSNLARRAVVSSTISNAVS
ncbi:MAG TPA: hypothetical protein VIU11_25945 [Nakamurella sp.]